MGKHSNNIRRRNDKQKNVKKKRIWLRILLIILLIIICVAAVFAIKVQQNGGGLKGIVTTVVGSESVKVEDLDKLQFLLLGDNMGLTDSIMVCSYDPKTQDASILSIPRDTFIGKNKNKATASDKINSLYQGENVDRIMNAVSDLTGIELEYYIVVETDALIELVDAIGGVMFDVPIDMKYDDPADGLHIDLEAGEQLIDGEKAEQLLRFRHNNNGTSYPVEYGDNDYGRMRTQREFITEALKQTLKVSNITKISNLLKIVEENVQTNIEFDEIKDYLPYVVEFNTENLQTGALPGASQKLNGVWVFLHNQAESEELITQLFFPELLEEEEESEETEATENVVNAVN